MKGYRFYLEFESSTAKRKNKNMGTVVAVMTDVKPYVSNNTVMREGFTALTDTPNSPVCFSSVSDDYLRERCKLISKEVAEVIHPQLFSSLNS